MGILAVVTCISVGSVHKIPQRSCNFELAYSVFSIIDVQCAHIKEGVKAKIIKCLWHSLTCSEFIGWLKSQCVAAYSLVVSLFPIRLSSWCLIAEDGSGV